MNWILENWFYIYIGATIVAFFLGGIFANLESNRNSNNTIFGSIVFALFWPLGIPVALFYLISDTYHKLMVTIADAVDKGWSKNVG